MYSRILRRFGIVRIIDLRFKKVYEAIADGLNRCEVM